MIRGYIKADGTLLRESIYLNIGGGEVLSSGERCVTLAGCVDECIRKIRVARIIGITIPCHHQIVTTPECWSIISNMINCVSDERSIERVFRRWNMVGIGQRV